MEEIREDIILCECKTPEHQIIVHYTDEGDENVSFPVCYLHYHLNKRPFWERVKYAFKYIFGFQSRFGAFGEMILNPQDVDKIEKICHFLRKSNE
jgi:hypothetical protein